MDRLIKVLILLAAATFIIAIAVGYGLVLRVFPAGTFLKFSVASLMFAIALTLLQIRDKK